MASAQLVRLGIPVTYAFEENLHNAIASIRKADEVIVVGSKLTDDIVKRLRSLYQHGCRIVLVGPNYKELEFAIVYNNGSVHTSLLDYSRRHRRNDTIQDQLAFLVEQQDAKDMIASIALNPVDDSYVSGAVSQRAQEGTLKGSPFYEAAQKKAAMYRFMESHSLL